MMAGLGFWIGKMMTAKYCFTLQLVKTYYIFTCDFICIFYVLYFNHDSSNSAATVRDLDVGYDGVVSPM